MHLFGIYIIRILLSKKSGRGELSGQKNQKRIREVREARVGKSGKEWVKEGKRELERGKALKP